MSKKRPGLEAVLNTIARGPGRSSLFYYLYDNHDEIARASAGRRIRWEPMAAVFHALELTDGDGKSATAETARKTWIKVRNEIRKQRVFQATGIVPVAAPRRKKLLANWLPSGFYQPNAPLLKGNQHQASPSTASPAVPQEWPAVPTGTALTKSSSGSDYNAAGVWCGAPKDEPTLAEAGTAASIREEMNLRSSRMRNGSDIHNRTPSRNPD